MTFFPVFPFIPSSPKNTILIRMLTLNKPLKAALIFDAIADVMNVKGPETHDEKDERSIEKF